LQLESAFATNSNENFHISGHGSPGQPQMPPPWLWNSRV